MVRCIFEERLEVEKGQLVRITNARWDTKRYGSGDLDVFKIYEDGRELCRNLYYSRLGGYLLDEPNSPDGWSEPLLECRKFHEGFGTAVLSHEIALVTDKYPGFRWMLEKGMAGDRWMSIARLWDYLTAWKRWPESERLINGGYEKLALSETFAKVPYQTQKRMAEYLKQHPEIIDPGFGELREIMKTGKPQWQYKLKKSLRLKHDVMDYYTRLMNREGIADYERARQIHYQYEDYIEMAKDIGHDVTDPYWKFPSDLKAAHDKVMKEKERKEAAKQRRKNKKFAAAVERFAGKTLKVNDIEVRVPSTINEVVHQAEVLHQCLVYADYIGKVSERKCLLVFVMCNGEPLATAELDRKGNVVQFYGDERVHDFNLMKPSAEAEAALRIWIAKYKPKIKATSKNVKEAA